jgi:translation elongation factor EF-Tu-like GTPase
MPSWLIDDIHRLLAAGKAGGAMGGTDLEHALLTDMMDIDGIVVSMGKMNWMEQGDGYENLEALYICMQYCSLIEL